MQRSVCFRNVANLRASLTKARGEYFFLQFEKHLLFIQTQILLYMVVSALLQKFLVEAYARKYLLLCRYLELGLKNIFAHK